MSRMWGIEEFHEAISANNRLKYQLKVFEDDLKIIQREVSNGTFDESEEVVDEMILDINDFSDKCESFLDCSAAVEIIRDMGHYSKPIAFVLRLEDLVSQASDAIKAIDEDIESCEESMNYLEEHHIYD